MNWREFFKGGIFSVYLVALFLTVYSLLGKYYPLPEKNLPEVLAATASASFGQFPTVPQPKLEIKPVNILLLGLDSRKDDKSVRCDAIHMISFQPEKERIIIYSVPRGTLVNETYIANTCQIKDIEKIIGLKADHVVKVGFSQAQGLLRLAGLPAVPALEYLRDRKDYLIGDQQRSYNQGLFIRDGIIKYVDWAAKLPEPMQRLAFNMIDTDLTFDQAKNIFNQLVASEIYKNPRNIGVIIKPTDGLTRQELHFTDTNINWQNEPEFKTYQQDLIKYLEKITKNNDVNKINLAISKQLWLQIEDESLRNYWQSKLSP